MKQWKKAARCDDPAYLHPLLRERVEAVRAEVQQAFDPALLRLTLYETGRSPARQARLEKQDPLQALDAAHLTGRAADLVPEILINGAWQPTWSSILTPDDRTLWDLLTAAAARHGLVRLYLPARFAPRADGPHVQLPDDIGDW